MARRLQQAYRLHALQAVSHERAIQQAVELLRSAGVEPVLVKGWAIARLYPERGLRPYGDLDLCVPPEHHALAEGVLKGIQGPRHPIDLHRGFTKLDKRPWDELYARSCLVDLQGVDVRVLSAEDHLRVLCLHLLRHGAWRPLWLCDIAAALELRSRAFNWNDCLGQSLREAEWVTCAMTLAHELLGASLEGVPVASGQPLPRWLLPEVLKNWANPFPAAQAPMKYHAAMVTYVRHPTGILKDLGCRWPNPIAAMVNLGGPFSRLPRLAFQLTNCFLRTIRFLLQLPRLVLRKQHVASLLPGTM